MKDIKEKVRDKNPKIRNPASRLPKELVRSAMLETKEKSRMVADKVGRETGEESPVEYAGNRIERAEQFGQELGMMLEQDIPAFLAELGRAVRASDGTFAQWYPAHEAEFKEIAERYIAD